MHTVVADPMRLFKLIEGEYFMELKATLIVNVVVIVGIIGFMVKAASI